MHAHVNGHARSPARLALLDLASTRYRARHNRYEDLLYNLFTTLLTYVNMRAARTAAATRNYRDCLYGCIATSSYPDKTSTCHHSTCADRSWRWQLH